MPTSEIAACTGYQAQGPTTPWSIDGKGGWDRQKSNTSVVKATMMNQIAFPRILKENAVKENSWKKSSSKKDFPQKINFQRTYAAALRGVAAVS